ncbi:PREDICTED: Rieske domain-containing protein [Nanorana parkeri]|uniref:Rieske domain-containing protein n=1 Tax=Nanorana parkeri TaxID=125878 RepID=UPI0008542769|nr:PREDICTED: Rieske domain-containing protein [Nanorana parkeri]
MGQQQSVNAEPEEIDESAVLVAQVEDFKSSKRLRTTVNDREIVIFHHLGKYHALDLRCYHSGGPLHLGEIEDIGGWACVVCPWHKYKIVLESGEGLYQGVDPHEQNRTKKWFSKGVKQRTHKVTVSNGGVYVTLSDTSSMRCDSDVYAKEKFNDQPCPDPVT